MIYLYILNLFKGAKITLMVALVAFPFALCLGMIFAILELNHNFFVRKITSWITYFFRGLPELLVIFGIYFGTTVLLSNLSLDINVNPFIAGALSLGLVFAAYCSQAFKGAFLTLHFGQKESAIALGLNRKQVLNIVLIPQALRHALPALSNLWAVLLKDTSLVSLIGLSDLLNNAKIAANVTYKPFFFYLGAALIYFFIVTISQFFFNLLTKRLSKFGS